MQFSLNKLLTKMFLLIFIWIAAGCQSNTNEVSAAYSNYKFDLKVIENLPVYDSLILSIWEKLSLFQQHIDKNDAYQVYRYIPDSYEPGTFQKLLKEPGPKVDYYFAKLGKDLIYRFDVFKDSTVKIYIRDWPYEATRVDIEENLSYYPSGTAMQQRTFPAKDTILTKHWQYWMRVNTRRFF